MRLCGFVSPRRFSVLKDKLLDCLNFALREVATDYLPFVKAENVVVDNGSLKYSDLKETFSKAVSLFIGGEETDFETTPSEIKTKKDGNGVLTYRYIPKTLTANDEICDCRLKTEYMVNGTLCYYYFSGGMYDLAEQSHPQTHSSTPHLPACPTTPCIRCW